MINDIEGKAKKSTEPKSLEDRIMNSNIPKSESEWWAKKEIEKLREQILSLTTKVDKKIKLKDLGNTVYRLRDFIRIFGDKIEVKDLEDFELEIPATTKPLNEKEVEDLLYKIAYMNSNYEKSKAICSHFSKQIKYPEKYELFEDDRNVDMSLGEAKMGMNNLIDEMKRLNGEGGV